MFISYSSHHIVLFRHRTCLWFEIKVALFMYNALCFLVEVIVLLDLFIVANVYIYH